MSDIERDKVVQYKRHCGVQCDTVCNTMNGTKWHGLLWIVTHQSVCLPRAEILKAILRWVIRKLNELRWKHLLTMTSEIVWYH